jgi:hypothetical protein
MRLNPFIEVEGRKLYLDPEKLRAYQAEFLDPDAGTVACQCGCSILNCAAFHQSQDVSCQEMDLVCQRCLKKYPVGNWPQRP